MVKRSRDQSQEAPRRLSWRTMVPPDSSFHSQTRRTNSSRPRSRRWIWRSASRRSTTICVAMPAWSMPGCHSTSLPRMRSKRQRMSWIVLLRACPMWSEPVTFGGGMTIVYGSAPLRSSRPALKASASSQRVEMRASTAEGSNVLSIMMNTGQLARRTRKQDGYKPDGSVEVNRGATIFELFPFAWNHLFFFGLPHFLTANRTHFAEKCSRPGGGRRARSPRGRGARPGEEDCRRATPSAWAAASPS